MYGQLLKHLIDTIEQKLTPEPVYNEMQINKIVCTASAQKNLHLAAAYLVEMDYYKDWRLIYDSQKNPSPLGTTSISSKFLPLEEAHVRQACLQSVCPPALALLSFGEDMSLPVLMEAYENGTIKLVEQLESGGSSEKLKNKGLFLDVFTSGVPGFGGYQMAIRCVEDKIELGFNGQLVSSWNKHGAWEDIWDVKRGALFCALTHAEELGISSMVAFSICQWMKPDFPQSFALAEQKVLILSMDSAASAGEQGRSGPWIKSI